MRLGGFCAVVFICATHLRGLYSVVWAFARRFGVLCECAGAGARVMVLFLCCGGAGFCAVVRVFARLCGSFCVYVGLFAVVRIFVRFLVRWCAFLCGFARFCVVRIFVRRCANLRGRSGYCAGFSGCCSVGRVFFSAVRVLCVRAGFVRFCGFLCGCVGFVSAAWWFIPVYLRYSLSIWVAVECHDAHFPRGTWIAGRRTYC